MPWRLADAVGLPPSGDIWRSLFFETPQAGAESTLLASLGPALSGPGRGGGPAVVAGIARAGFVCLADGGRGDGCVAGQRCGDRRPLAGRALLADGGGGALHAPLLRRMVQRMADCGIALRMVLLAHDQEALAGVGDLLAETPGSRAYTWEALPAEERQRFDVVVDLYGLSAPVRQRLGIETLTGLLAPGGLLLGVEPAESRLSTLLFGPAIDPDFDPAQPHAVQSPEAWCAALADAGCGNARQMLLDGALWPAVLLAASLGLEPAADPRQAPDNADLVVFAAPDDPLAAALSARQGMLRLLPIEALKDALTAPFAAKLHHLLLLTPGAMEEESGIEALPELLADISAALVNMPAAARLWLVARGSPETASLPAGLAGLRRVSANELSGLDCRTLCLDAELPPAEAAERIAQELADPDDEPEAYWRSGGGWCRGSGDICRSGGPVAGPRRLEVQRPGLIGSLAWQAAAPRRAGAGRGGDRGSGGGIEFPRRDVGTRSVADEALLDGFSGASLGLECAGVVMSVGEGVDDLAPGDHVVAVAPAALATHAVTRRNGVMRLPAGLDFAAGATIPVAFMTRGVCAWPARPPGSR